jgi:hypothetical protein
LRPEVTLARLRRFLLALAAVLLAGAVVELLLVEHTEDTLQLLPFVLCGLGVVAIIVALVRPARLTLLALRVLMPLVAAGSLLGVYLHVESNLELERELNPGMAAGPLLLGALGGANPLLAPGVLAVAAVLALAAAYQHPALARREAERSETGHGKEGRVNDGRDAEDRRDGATAAAGDEVESAGETTAAATIGGDNDNAKPVGSDTQVRVEGDAHPSDG